MNGGPNDHYLYQLKSSIMQSSVVLVNFHFYKIVKNLSLHPNPTFQKWNGKQNDETYKTLQRDLILMAVILAANLAIGVLDLQYIHLCMVLCKRYRFFIRSVLSLYAWKNIQDAEQDHGAHHSAFQDLPCRGTKSSDASGTPGTRYTRCKVCQVQGTSGRR